MKVPSDLWVCNISSTVLFAASRLLYVGNPNIERDSQTLHLHQILTTCSVILHRESFTAFSTTKIKHQNLSILNLHINYLL